VVHECSTQSDRRVQYGHKATSLELKQGHAAHATTTPDKIDNNGPCDHVPRCLATTATGTLVVVLTSRRHLARQVGFTPFGVRGHSRPSPWRRRRRKWRTSKSRCGQQQTEIESCLSSVTACSPVLECTLLGGGHCSALGRPPGTLPHSGRAKYTSPARPPISTCEHSSRECRLTSRDSGCSKRECHHRLAIDVLCPCSECANGLDRHTGGNSAWLHAWVCSPLAVYPSDAELTST
jgi:hypothetical protein